MSARPLSLDLILVPVDQSDEAIRAAEYAVAIAAEYGAKVHAIHVLGEDVVRAIEQGVVDENAVAAEGKVVTDTVTEIANEAGVTITTSVAYGFSTTSKLLHPGSVVLDTAEELDSDFIVVPREPVTSDPGEILAKAAEYVLLYASQPVLSV
ncbi:universal stress protein [Haloferax sp. DFSO60]|uniref:universal stress protein n=1 Tax=Haloferax sp. DFSO60 TaxID=3388652 RepID=UPI00397D3358